LVYDQILSVPDSNFLQDLVPASASFPP
jgi:hypothetical protein